MIVVVMDLTGLMLASERVLGAPPTQKARLRESPNEAEPPRALPVDCGHFLELLAKDSTSCRKKRRVAGLERQG